MCDCTGDVSDGRDRNEHAVFPQISAGEKEERACRDLSRAFSPKNDLDGLKEYHDIQKEIPVLHVVQIERQLRSRILIGSAVRVADLSPPGDAGFELVANIIE